MTLKIGIPRGLAYYAYGHIWEAYFRNLGCEIILSPQTNKGMIDDGTKETVGEACIPIKIFHGHVMWLQGKVDYIFIPRLCNVRRERNVTFCPKFLGLPDLVQASIPKVENLLAPEVTTHGKYSRLLYLGMETAKKIGINPIAGAIGMLKAILKNNKPKLQQSPGKLTFALVGYPYFLHDNYLNFNIIAKLKSCGVNVVNSDLPHSKLLDRYKHKLPRSLFWEFSNRVILATYYFLDALKVDGIIHLTAFACGPDAMVGKLIELECKQRSVPFLDLTIDEQTGEAGMLTRIEAFVDMFDLRGNEV